MPMPRTVDAVMLEQRAASFRTRSIKASAKMAGLRLAMSMVDLTTLEGKDSPEKVRALCRKAVMPGVDHQGSALAPVAAVCVYPNLVAVAREELAGTPIKVASVATGFPSGQYPLAVRIEDTRRAIRDGADEIDMVISRGSFLAGKYDLVAEEIREFKAVCNASPSIGGDARAHVHLKVILETGELETYDNARRASDLAIEALLVDGADGPAGTGFIKTSTGKVTPAATMPVTLCMLEAIRDCFLSTGHMIGMKPAGGIRTAKDALHYLVMVKETLGDRWLNPDWFRFGASALVDDLVRQIRKQGSGKYSARYDYAEA
ncbi:MAG: deoxyribose-phosphate aldolase [Phycisphaeraceae bacterium]|nr:deoxyribose-phosphate aldolase [Phycisphaeraceae bacterium]